MSTLMHYQIRQQGTKMNTRTLFSGTIALLLLAGASSQAADTMTRFDSRSGSKVRIEGTSSVHDWQVEGKLIGGHLEAGPNFPTEPGQSVEPGKVDAKVEAFIPVRSLMSIEKDGRPYKATMDDSMYGKLKVENNPKIFFYLSELVLKETPKTKDAAYVFDAKGDLVVAGATNKISMPVSVLPLGDKKLKISGKTDAKMTDFGIKPVELSIGPLSIKTGDEVKLSFDWMVAHKAPAPAAASK